MIKVIYMDKNTGIVDEQHLQRLLATGKIAAYCRSEDWIIVKGNIMK